MIRTIIIGLCGATIAGLSGHTYLDWELWTILVTLVVLIITMALLFSRP